MIKLNLMISLAVMASISCKSEQHAQDDSTSLKSSKGTASTSSLVYGTRTIDFTGPNGGYSKALYENDFGNDHNYSGNSTVSTSEAGRMYIEGNTLRVKMLANQIGDTGGMWSYTAIGRSTTTKVLQYDVKFGYTSVPFDWSMGGKIPGLGGGLSYSGCVDASSGNGWTSRLMWRQTADGKAYLMPYLYYKDKPSTCGDDFGQKYLGADGTGLKGGRWYRIKMEITLNTSTNYNGILKISIQENVNGMWSPGTILINRTGLRFATTAAGLEIDQLLTGVYRGGSTTSWASATDGFIFLDNISWSD